MFLRNALRNITGSVPVTAILKKPHSCWQKNLRYIIPEGVRTRTALSVRVFLLEMRQEIQGDEIHMHWWIIATVLAYFVKGVCGMGNTLVFTSVLSFANSNVNISPVELLLGYPPIAFLCGRNGAISAGRSACPLSPS